MYDLTIRCIDCEFFLFSGMDKLLGKFGTLSEAREAAPGIAVKEKLKP